MTKRNLFTAIAAIFVSAAFLAGCDHALSQQTASVTLSIPADVIMAMTKDARPASEQEIAKMALASRQAADSTGAYATLTVSLSRHAAPQTRFFTEEEFLEVEGGDKEIPPFIFTGLPVGAHVTVTASLLLANGTYYEDSAEALLAVGPNSVSLMLRRMSLPQLAGTFTRTPDSDQINAGTKVAFEFSDPDARLSLKITKDGQNATNNDVQVDTTTSGGTFANGEVEVTKNSVGITFNAAGSYTVTPTASKDGYQPQTEQPWSFAVETPQLGGAFTRNPDTNQIKTGEQVTFEFSDPDAKLSLKITKDGQPATSSDVQVDTTTSGGTFSDGEVTVTTSSVGITFNTAGSYTVTPTASRDGYSPQTEQPWSFAVETPQLAGTFTRTPDQDDIKVGAQVTFGYSVTDAKLSLKITKDGQPATSSDIDVAKTSGGTFSDGEVEVTTSSVAVTFNAAGSYTVTPTASKDGYQPQTGAAYSIAVVNPKLAGTISASVPTGTTLTHGQTVTFTYTADNTGVASNVTIHLPFDDAAGVTGGTRSADKPNEITGTGGSVTLTFNPTDDGKTYTISGAYASLTDYQNSNTVDFNYTVNFPPLGGTFSPTSTSTSVTRGQAVTFSHSDPGAAISLALAKTGGGAVTASDVTVSGGSLSGSTVTATGNPANSVTLTFNAAGSYTVTPTASKDGYSPQTGAAYSIAVGNPALGGQITATPAAGAGNPQPSGTTLTRGDSVTFAYSGSESVSISVSGLPSGATEDGNGKVTFGSATSSAATITVTAQAAGYLPKSQQFTYTVQAPQLPEPTLTVTGATQEAGDKYYTNGGDVTVKAGNTSGLPAGTRLYYKIGNNPEQNVEPAKGFTLPIQGSAYSVQYWYGGLENASAATRYRNSATQTKSCTVWLDSRQIKVTASSRNATGNDDTKEATGSSSSTSLAHQFYGVTGSTFTFSIASGASGISVSQSTANLRHNERQTVSVRAMKGGAAVSETVTFTLSATMRPITFTLQTLVLVINFSGNDYGTKLDDTPDIAGSAWVTAPDIGEQRVWHCDTKNDFEVPKNSRRPVNLDGGGQTRYTVTTPDQTFTMKAHIVEVDVTTSNDVLNTNTTSTCTAATLYNNLTQTVSNNKDCAVEFTFAKQQQ